MSASLQKELLGNNKKCKSLERRLKSVKKILDNANQLLHDDRH